MKTSDGENPRLPPPYKYHPDDDDDDCLMQYQTTLNSRPTFVMVYFTNITFTKVWFKSMLICLLFHDLLLSAISQHSDWSELTSHNSLHCSVVTVHSLDARRNTTTQ